MPNCEISILSQRQRNVNQSYRVPVVQREPVQVQGMVVWIIGAKPLYREGLRSHLQAGGFDVTADGATVNDVVLCNDLARREPDVVVLDEVQGTEAVARLKQSWPLVRVVVLATSADPPQLAAMFGAGADGYLLKNIVPDALVESLRLATLGEKVFPSTLSGFLGQIGSNPVNEKGSVRIGDVLLSHREHGMMWRLADGKSNKAIALELGLTEATVKVHMKKVLRKLGLANRTQVAIWAIQRGLTRNSLQSA